MRLSLRRKRPHPDEVEARKWVSEQIDRLRALSYDDLLEQLDEPDHYTIRSRTGRELMGETQVSGIAEKTETSASSWMSASRNRAWSRASCLTTSSGRPTARSWESETSPLSQKATSRLR